MARGGKHGGEWVASGEDGPDPNVYVWDAEDPTRPVFTLKTLHKDKFKGVSALAFSPEGNFLAVAYKGPSHIIKVYNLGDNSGGEIDAWTSREPKVQTYQNTRSGAGPYWVWDMAWLDESTFISTSVKYAYKWTMKTTSRGGKLEEEKFKWSKNARPKGGATAYSVSSFRGTSSYLVGATGGNIYQCSGNGTKTKALKQSFSKGNSSHTAIYAEEAHNRVVCSGSSGEILLTDLKFEKVASKTIEEDVRSICYQKTASGKESVVVGTLEGSIIEWDVSEGTTTYINQGHGHMKEKGSLYEGEL